MCLGIPGRIVEISDPTRKLATIDVAGVRREVNVMCIEGDAPLDTLVGAWVLIHVGFAMSRIDEEEARATLDILAQMGEAEDEVAAMRASERMLGAER
ncbi:HypC/HybG/HupF family hydrogenase formation chaperone [Tropicimonas sp. IMCC6043]|uniref:HypC/HybG/HupF family hydrogenase formation chaperone n=1 Tax=Tropicimonas sp. IMCC6043 TaxID=2510645 RepID=UPI00101C32FA|nr:HypC/HybG/HupF family hydrogenase formation chaperone [Tropicimonas sp. IMCC6043]RYH10810.1 HypC/HybG/HupF family hydrogenase formation chaperone [Tropicimonas sp. IMCC6043]